MRRPTTSSRHTWKACFSGALFRKPPGYGPQCVRSTISPLIQSVWGWRDFPHFRRSPCMEENCRRCTEFLGGFKFPWLGTWNSSAVLALPGSDPRLAWQSYYDRLGEAKLDLLLIEPLRTHWTARDFAPDNIFGLVAFIEHNAESMVDLAELWDVWRKWQSPRRGWRDPSLVPIPADLVAWRAPRARAVRSLWGWLGAMEAGEEPLPPCRACGIPTLELCERLFLFSVQYLSTLPVSRLSPQLA